MKKNRSDILVTLAVIGCSAVLLCALFIAIGGNPFAAPHLRFTVDMADSGGLIQGSDVTYSGHVVGEVSGIELLEPTERLPGRAGHGIRIGVNVRQKIDLPENIRATVKAASLLGSNHLALELEGDIAIGSLKEGTKLVGVNGGSLDSLVPGGADLVEGIAELVENLNTVVVGLGGTESGRNAALAFENLRDISAELKEAIGGERGAKALAEKLHGVADDLHVLIAGEEGMEEDSLKARIAALTDNLNATASGWRETFGGEDGVNMRIAGIAGGLDKLVNGDPAAEREGLRESLPELAREMKGVAEEARVVLVYAEYFAGSLAAKPRRLLFGDNEDLRLPTKDEILDYYRREGESPPIDPSTFEAEEPKEERSRPLRFGPKR